MMGANDYSLENCRSIIRGFYCARAKTWNARGMEYLAESKIEEWAQAGHRIAAACVRERDRRLEFLDYIERLASDAEQPLRQKHYDARAMQQAVPNT